MGGLTMTKYIECKAVFALIRPDDPNDERCAVTVATAKRLIRHALAVAPAADVAPVTRCKDCKYAYINYCGKDMRDESKGHRPATASIGRGENHD